MLKLNLFVFCLLGLGACGDRTCEDIQRDIRNISQSNIESFSQLMQEYDDKGCASAPLEPM